MGLSTPCGHLNCGYMRIIMSSSSTACPHAAFTSAHGTSSRARPSRKPLIVPNLSWNLHSSRARESWGVWPPPQRACSAQSSHL